MANSISAGDVPFLHGLPENLRRLSWNLARIGALLEQMTGLIELIVRGTRHGRKRRATPQGRERRFDFAAGEATARSAGAGFGKGFETGLPISFRPDF